MSAKLLLRVLVVAWLAVLPARGQGFGFGNYQVESSTRVGRTDFDYVMRITVTNQAASAQGVRAQVFSLSADTTVLEGEVFFGDVALGASAVSSDTFTIRQNRLVAFDPSQLMWFALVDAMALGVTITSPASGYLTNGTNVVVTGTVGPAVESVQVRGVNAPLNGNNFSAVVALEEGRNVITAVAGNQYGGQGNDSINVTRDTVAPLVSVQEPVDGAVVVARQITVSGLVNDAVPGTVNPEQASVMVNGLASTVVNRTYSISEVLLVPGSNTISVVARDRAGNETTRRIGVTFHDAARQKRLVMLGGDAQSGMIGTILPEALLVELVDGDGVPQTNQPVSFAVTRNDGAVLSPPDSGRNLTVPTDEKGQARVLFQLGGRTGAGNNQVAASSAGVLGDVLFNANATGSPPAKVSALIPETQVGVTGQPLPLPWSAFVTDAGGNPVGGAPITFSVYQGSGSFSGASSVSTNTDGDGRASAIMTLGAEAGLNNNIAVASVAGVAGSSAVFTATALTERQAADTRILGVVLDQANRPMSNILCSIPGTALNAVTDTQGQFVLAGVPVGAVRLFVDGRNRGYPGEWHYLQFDLVTVAGQDNSVDRPIYMLNMDQAGAKLAGGATDVTLQLTGVQGSELTVYAHSLRNANGQPITNLVSWTQVNAQRVPMQPPSGSQFALAWSVQPANLRFNPPAKVCIPNTLGQPGQVFEMFGFDHDIGAFVSIGTGTVTPDGSQICSDPGFGIVKSGWGGAAPPPPPCTPVCGPAPMDTDCIKYETIPPASKCDCPTYKPVDKVKFTKVEAKANGMDEVTVSTNDTVNFSVIVQQEGCPTLKYQWNFGDGETSDQQSPTHKYKEAKTFKPTVAVSCQECPGGKSDDAKVIVVGVNLTIHKPKVIDSGEAEIPDVDELTKGAQTFVNFDNDDADTKFDLDDNAVAGEDDMIKVKLQIKNKDAKDGTAKLEVTAGGSDVKIWKEATKGTEYASGTALTVPGDFMVAGDMLEKIVYVEGIKAQTSQQATKLKFTYDKATGEMDEAAITVLGVESLTWEGKNNSRNDNNTLDADPNWPVGLAPAALRVFPDARISGGAVEAERDKVTVKAKLSVAPIEAVKVFFNSYDVDDPTTNAAPVDDDTANADDNRGATPRGPGKLDGADGSGIAEVSFDAIEKTFEFQTTMQPGDNFRLVASGDKDFFGNLENHDKNLGADNADKQRIIDKNVSGSATDKEVRETTKYVSPALVVWRFVHVETDTMRASTTNFLDGNITALDTGDSTTAKAVTVNPSPRDGSFDLDSAAPNTENGRFDKGALRVANTHTISPLDGNGQNDFRRATGINVCATALPFEAEGGGAATMSGTVTRIRSASVVLDLNVTAHSGTNIVWTNYPGGRIRIAGGAWMNITAADAANSRVTVAGLMIAFRATDDDSTNAPPAPDTSRLVEAFGPVYIIPLMDIGGTDNNLIFIGNVLGDSTAEVSSGWKFDSVANEASTKFWTVYVRNSWQHTSDGDNDADGEGQTLGIVDNINGVGANVYWEVLRAAEFTANAAAGKSEAYTLAHEVGHLFGGLHNDGCATTNCPEAGLMAQTSLRVSPNFNPPSLDKFRRLLHP